MVVDAGQAACNRAIVDQRHTGRHFLARPFGGGGDGRGNGGMVPHSDAAGVVILAMVAYFAGVTQAPITAFVIVLEITGKATDPVPLIAAAVIATGVGHILCPVSLYHSLAKSFIGQPRDKCVPIAAGSAF
jgi:H+/Cl- antiporter ClcA